MNIYKYDEIQLGQIASFTVTITPTMMEQFREITGDINPLHCDEHYAINNGFPGRVVYGMLVSSMYSTLAGVFLPGKNSLLYEVGVKMRKPVFIGDILTVSGTVSEKNDTCRLIFVKAQIENQDGKKISTAILEIGVRE